jgi:hypothetical protein
MWMSLVEQAAVTGDAMTIAQKVVKPRAMTFMKISPRAAGYSLG